MVSLTYQIVHTISTSQQLLFIYWVDFERHYHSFLPPDECLGFHIRFLLLFRESRGDVTAFIPHFQEVAGLLGPNPVNCMGESQGTPGMSPLLTAAQGANCKSGAILGFSILLKDTSTCGSAAGEPGLKPVTFQSLVHQLHPLSFSRPT